METVANVVRQRLQSLREERGLSQTELAKLIGIKPGSISEWEAGKRTPSIAALCDLATALCASLDYLCGRTDMVDGIVSTYPTHGIGERDRLAESMEQSQQTIYDNIGKLETAIAGRLDELKAGLARFYREWRESDGLHPLSHAPAPPIRLEGISLNVGNGDVWDTVQPVRQSRQSVDQILGPGCTGKAQHCSCLIHKQMRL